MLVALAAVLVASNLLSMPSIERRASPSSYKVFDRHGSMHLRDVARDLTSNVRNVFRFPLEVGAVAAGRELYVVEPVAVRAGDLFGLARPAVVHRISGGLSITDRVVDDLRSVAAAEGEMRGQGPFTVVADTSSSETPYVVFEHDGRIFAAPVDLLPQDAWPTGAPAP